MNPISKTRQADSPAVGRLDSVCMSDAKRALAKQQMRQAERVADLIVAVVRFLGSTAGRWKGRPSPSQRIGAPE